MYPRTGHVDPAYDAEVRALLPRLPASARWFSSPEPQALETAQLLTSLPVTAVAGPQEHVQDSTDWIDEFGATVARAFAHPDEPACDGWEPLTMPDLLGPFSRESRLTRPQPGPYQCRCRRPGSDMLGP